ncbi:recombination regulator RecX [Acinetobacter ursingii]|uniref:Regulatory protein RecX n=1 Tax=Acinetobacter ursingii TaxID=108980 RepID=A0AA46NRG8_9GAMM|nr:regulatory protein RecX [Acinetobacter ursingii]NOZ98182.1 regulatory protein RecX [Gammaproteobacteria bacterium]ENV76976.1 regulatory protein recX [Acinetobacter ursingii DSM 16037 = CIP 107286]MCH2015325.1 recombination regulator RecX [Acinetobacter ursingii]MCU4496150.1 recombination regulator RecX [Acinetobacter ursingii]MDA3578756.1 recombination regulator RecX [Acinetobacter ursingii]
MYSNSDDQANKPLLTGTRLRSYAFALLTRKEYAKAELIEKLSLYAQDRDEVLALVEELSERQYQSDQRVAEMVLSSQIRKGKGPNRIKQALKHKQLDSNLILEDIQDVDWFEQAYQLKVKKFGIQIEKDPKQKAKQIRFLKYRGFDMNVIMKAISRTSEEE